MAKAKTKDVPENETNDTKATDQDAVSQREELRESIKAARADVRSLLEFVIDLQVPGHGEKQSHKLLDAIDQLIRIRLEYAMGGTPLSTPFDEDVKEIEEIVAEQIKAQCPTLDQIEGLFKGIAEKAIADALDKATDPKDGK